ncbi:hypothetical protein [Isoptericola sp. AK164]|uniref:hypothetical protein n=1 Tax=Isoptericola sp. AK164 TaxID=3024246 RepID=UPI0024182706|nr:hypothetical protein [Isoptericola sp. AK164]
MGLRRRLVRFALAQPRVLLVVAPDGAALARQVESVLLRRGWPPATSPADTDLLVVAGAPGPELAAAVEVLWAQVPAPRASARLTAGDDVGVALDGAAEALQAWDAQRTRAGAADGDPWLGRGPEPEEGHGGHEGHEGGHEGHEGGHEGHEGHDEGGHGGHGSMLVAGLPMASSAPDRDGLELETLSLTLGPWMPGAPDGLLVQAAMQGDVLTELHVRWADTGPGPLPERPVRALDAICRVLTLSGPERLLGRARRVRDAVVQHQPSGADGAVRLGRDLRRSRTLAWSLRGIPAPGGGDVLDRLVAWCDVLDGAAPPAAADPATVAAALDGSELAGARLAVACVDVGPGEPR